MPVLSLHICMCTMFMPVAWKNQKNIVRYPSTGITDSFELWMMEMNRLQEKGLLGKQISNVYIE